MTRFNLASGGPETEISGKSRPPEDSNQKQQTLLYRIRP